MLDCGYVPALCTDSSFGDANNLLILPTTPFTSSCLLSSSASGPSTMPRPCTESTALCTRVLISPKRCMKYLSARASMRTCMHACVLKEKILQRKGDVHTCRPQECRRALSGHSTWKVRTLYHLSISADIIISGRTYKVRTLYHL